MTQKGEQTRDVVREEMEESFAVASTPFRRSWFFRPTGRSRVEPTTGHVIPAFTSFVEHTETRASLLEKIFGVSHKSDEVDLLDDEAAQVEKSVMFSPFSEWRERWEMLMVVLTVYSCFVTPARIAFGDASIGAAFIIDALIDGIYLADIILTFQTGIVKNGVLNMERKAVCRRYLLGTFTLDFLSAFPLELTYHIALGERDAMMLRYVRLNRLGRFVRLPRLLAYMSTWQERLTMNSTSMRIVKLIFLIVVFAHFDACAQMFVAEIEGFPQEGWVCTSQLHDASSAVQYSHSLFKALSHMLCIGYGAAPPATLAEIWVTVISMVIGASFYIVLFGIMGALMLSLDRSGALYDETLDHWQEYFRFCRLPQSLRRRIMAYLKHKYHTRKMFDEGALLHQLPDSLRTDVQIFLCEDLLTHVPFFKACRDVVVRALVSKMTHVAFCPGDYVFFRGEPADNLYFILHGMIQIENEDGSVLTVLSTGSHFGEFALLAHYKGDPTTHRMANARALSYCNIYALSCHGFKQVADRFPEVVALLESTATSRTKMNEHKRQSQDGQF